MDGEADRPMREGLIQASLFVECERALGALQRVGRKGLAVVSAELARGKQAEFVAKLFAGRLVHEDLIPLFGPSVSSPSLIESNPHGRPKRTQAREIRVGRIMSRGAATGSGALLSPGKSGI